jgi:hypothetical protein
MEKSEDNFNSLDSRSRDKVLCYFVLLYPDYDSMDYEDRWYAEWDKLIIADNLPNMNLRYKRIIRRGFTTDPLAAVREAYNGTLTDYYDSFLPDDRYSLISDHLTDIHRKFIDRKFFCLYNGIDFDPEKELTTITDQIKAENNQKSLGTTQGIGFVKGQC